MAVLLIFVLLCFRWCLRATIHRRHFERISKEAAL